MDIFICDQSIFCQFDLRTVEDAGPYNARKNAAPFFRAYREKHGLIPIIVRTFQPSGLAIFQFVHFLHPSPYNTNRQRKQFLCRSFVPANSPLRTTEKGFDAFSLAQQAQRKSFAKRKRRYGDLALFFRSISASGEVFTLR